MLNLATVQIVADTTGVLMYLPGDTLQYKQQAPRAPDMTPVLTFNLPGESYAVEYDSTGEVYVIFMDANGQDVSGPTLLVRGMSVIINAVKIRVYGIRRAGVIRITAGQNGARQLVSNSPSGFTETANLIYPIGTNGTTGPAGWTTIAHPAGFANSYIAYNSLKSLDLSGVLGGPARRITTDTVTPANYYAAQYGFVDMDTNGVPIRYYSYHDLIINAVQVGNTFAVDAQTYWRPAIIWQLTAAGVAANAPTPGSTLITYTNYTYKRVASQTRFDFS